MTELVRYQTKPTQSGIFLVRYQTELMDAGMPMPALAFLMPMPSDANEAVFRVAIVNSSLYSTEYWSYQA